MWTFKDLSGTDRDCHELHEQKGDPLHQLIFISPRRFHLWQVDPAGCQVPIKCALSLPSTAGEIKHYEMFISWDKERSLTGYNNEKTTDKTCEY